MVEKIESPLLEEKIGAEIIDQPQYTPEQQTYLTNLKRRLTYARDERDKAHDEYDGMTYFQQWLQNEYWANTYIQPRRNKTDINFQSGTLRTKLFSFISAILSLNLSPDIIAYDENDIAISSLGNAMEDIMEKTFELENDEEKQILRVYELLKQGTVFIEEVWLEENYVDKQLTSEFDGTFNFKGWTQKKNKVTGQAVKNILSAKDVYLGNMRCYLFKEQPYVFTIESKTYKNAEALYGEWEMWKYVNKSKTTFVAGTGTEETDLFNASWSLLNHPQGEVEIVKYQSQSDNEYQILINGIPMLPIGFPLPWGRCYNIEQQNLEPIRQDFAYGKSFIFKNKNLVQLLDEMLKMGALKTYKSYMPAYLNTSEVIIPQSVLMPGRISMGIPANALKPVSDMESRGVTAGEFQMMEYIKRYVDENTSSQTFSGSKEQGTVTATQILELQRQARIMLGTIVLAVSLMEKKCDKLRLYNLLQNWFDPIDQTVDKVRNELKNRYRIVSRQRNVQGEGYGMRFIVPTEQNLTPEQVMIQENEMKTQIGKPVRIIAINPKVIKEADYVWMISINAREKKSSELNKLMFKQKIQDAIALGLPLDPTYVKEKFAEVWGDDPSKMFGATPPPQAPVQTGGQAGQPQNQGGVVLNKPQIGVEQTANKIANPAL